MTASPGSIAVLGAGSWGTALAILLARNGQAPLLWARDPDHVKVMVRERRNPRFLPDHPFPDGLSVTTDLEAAVGAARDVLLVVPSHTFRAVLERAAPVLGDAGLVWGTKGFEPETGRFLHEVVAELGGAARPAAVISGPTFAAEVASGLPGAVTIAARDERFAAALAARFHNPRFRVYTGTDMVGVQAGGAVKNVLALAAGIADGLGFGANTRAALVTRGLAELMRLGVALGGRRETFMGLAGLGDLLLTCTDNQSRNRRAGIALGQGHSVEQALREVGQVVEGVGAVREVMRIAGRLNVEMPISEQVHAVLHKGLAPEAAVNALLARAPGGE